MGAPFDFPNAPTVGQIFTPPGGPSYVWNGVAWMVATSVSYPTADSRNRIVNPAMQHSQENGTASVSTGTAYIVDQWVAQVAGISFIANKTTATAHQIGMQVSTGKTLAAGDYLGFMQPIEGVRLWDFNYGSAAAQPSILRFDVYSLITGTFGVALRNAAANRSMVLPFTVTAANTWQTFTFSIPGDTAGTWVVDNTASLMVSVSFAVGSTFLTSSTGWQAGNFLAPAGITNGALTTGNTFYIRNVGLYLDPQNTGLAPPWVEPDYASELIACKRYWQKYGTVVETAALYQGWAYPVQFRVIPSVTGGGAGFGMSTPLVDMFTGYQTTRAANTLVFNARM